jgi:hypothetical protein
LKLKYNKMKPFEEDKELKSLLKSIKLDSPETNFTVRVMTKIFQEESLIEKVKRERILGKGFWIILALFVALFVAMILASGSDAAMGGNMPRLVSEINSSGAAAGYQTFFQKLGTVPVSIAGILLASSLLLFIDKLSQSKMNIFSK